MILKSSVLVLQMDKFRQISTELWPLIDIINCFSFSIFGISLLIFFKLCLKRSSFKMIFFACKISHGGECCMPAGLLLCDCYQSSKFFAGMKNMTAIHSAIQLKCSHSH